MRTRFDLVKNAQCGVRTTSLRIHFCHTHNDRHMIISLLVAEAVLLLLVVVDRWMDIAPFNNLRSARAKPFGQRARDTFVECAPLLVAIACTAARFVPDAPTWMGIAPIAALSFAVASVVRATWLPWWNAAPAPVRARSTMTSARALCPGAHGEKDAPIAPIAPIATTVNAVTAAQDSEVHAFLEPRRAGAVVPSTFACLTHAHAVACVLMALVALVGS